LRRGRIDRFDTTTMRGGECGGSVRRRAVVSLLEKGLIAAPARSRSCREGRER
jgi:hypothetical protein